MKHVLSSGQEANESYNYDTADKRVDFIAVEEGENSSEGAGDGLLQRLQQRLLETKREVERILAE
jgi:hypothetical protein